MNHRSQKIKIAEKFMSHVWVDGGYREMGDFLIPQLVVMSPISESVGTEKLSDAFSLWFRGFPDLSYKQENIEIIDKRVFVDWVVKGNHLGDFLNIAPTGKSIKYSGKTMLTMVDNRIHSYHADVSLNDLVKQLSPQYKADIVSTNVDLFEHFNRIVGVHLSDRQIECLAFLCLHRTKKQISRLLGIEYGTLRTHLDRALLELGLDNPGQVFDWAYSTCTLELLIRISINKAAKK